MTGKASLLEGTLDTLEEWNDLRFSGPNSTLIYLRLGRKMNSRQ